MATNNEILISLGIDSEIAKENVQQYINNLRNAELLFDINCHIPEGTLEKYKQSMELIQNIKFIISEGFPSINPDKFIEFLITSPINSNKLDFSNLIKLFNLFNYQPSYKSGYSEIDVFITVVEPQKTIDIGKYLNIIMNLFTIFTFIYGEYKDFQSEERINERFDTQDAIIIQRGEELQYQIEIIENQNENIEEKINKLMEQQLEYNENQEKVIKLLNQLAEE